MRRAGASPARSSAAPTTWWRRSATAAPDGRTSEESLEVATDHVLGHGADVLGADGARAVHEEGLGHAVDAIFHGHLATVIGRVRERQPEAADELLGRLRGVLHVDPNHDHAALAVRPPRALEHRRLVVAGGIAPGGPEVHDHDLAAQRLECQRRAVE